MPVIDTILMETSFHAVATESGAFVEEGDRRLRITNKVDGSSAVLNLQFAGSLFDAYYGTQQLPVSDNRVGTTHVDYTGKGDEVGIYTNQGRVTFNAPEDLTLLIEEMDEKTTIIDVDGESVEAHIEEAK